jgi:hypothetical protein
MLTDFFSGSLGSVPLSTKSQPAENAYTGDNTREVIAHPFNEVLDL